MYISVCVGIVVSVGAVCVHMYVCTYIIMVSLTNVQVWMCQGSVCIIQGCTHAHMNYICYR